MDRKLDPTHFLSFADGSAFAPLRIAARCVIYLPRTLANENQKASEGSCP